jgi:hypothetical protein
MFFEGDESGTESKHGVMCCQRLVGVKAYNGSSGRGESKQTGYEIMQLTRIITVTATSSGCTVYKNMDAEKNKLT